MWKITKDKINELLGEQSIVGRTSRDWNEKRASEPMTRFRLLDDDKNIYFYGIMPDKDTNGDEDVCGAPLDWAMASYGCTILQHYNKSTRTWETIIA